jgi:hypothetical protein
MGTNRGSIRSMLALAIIVLATVMLGGGKAAALNTWTATGSMGTARSEHTMTLLPNGKALVTGGRDSTSTALASAELYDPGTGTWSPTGSMAAARTAHTATLLPNGKVLVAGGAGADILASAELYDPVAGTWAGTGSMATARLNHTATLLPDGTVLVTGGENLLGPQASAELYDPVSGTWTATGSMAGPRTDHTATLLLSGRALVSGGFGGGSELSTAELYDPGTGIWMATGSLAVAREGHTATLLPNGVVLAAGGKDLTLSLTLASAELYDPDTGAWSTTGSMTAARWRYTATLLANAKVLVAGGLSAASLASAELYDPVSGTWTATGSMTGPRTDHTATLLPNGNVLAAGGLDVPASTLATAELYDTGIPPSLNGFYLSLYTITGSPVTNLACGSEVGQTGTTISATTDCTTGTGGTLSGSASATNASGSIIFTTPPSVVTFSESISPDGWFGSGTWSCVSGCIGSGTHTSQRIAPSAPECSPPLPLTIPSDTTLTNTHGDQLFLAAGTVINGGVGPNVSLCSQIINLPVGVGVGSNIISRAYRLTPNGTTFSPPAIGIYHYADDEIIAGMTEANLKVAVFDSVQNRWRARDATNDPVNNTLTVPLDHFSDYAGGLDCGTGVDTDGLPLDNGPGVTTKDGTVPNSDGIPDLCDLDDDNDGLLDVDELSPSACGAFDLSGTSHPNPGSADITNDDNGDGNPAPPMGSDSEDDGPSWDTDNDGVLDGVECQLGFNPRDAASHPSVSQCGGMADADNDGLTVAVETCKWGTSDASADSDGDGIKDCVEANDLNGDGAQNFPGDTLNSAKASAGVIGRTMDFDLNGDGAVNFPGDTLLSAKMAAHAGGICM